MSCGHLKCTSLGGAQGDLLLCLYVGLFLSLPGYKTITVRKFMQVRDLCLPAAAERQIRSLPELGWWLQGGGFVALQTDLTGVYGK